MVLNLFGGKHASSKPSVKETRVSSSWAALLKELVGAEGQRVLDIGPTSSGNINFLTGLGHSVYMADLVGDLADPKWSHPPEIAFPNEAFLAANLDFSGRRFESVLFWDTGDYLPPTLRDAVVDRIYEVMEPGGKLLAFFHVKPDDELHRYHLRNDGQVDSQVARTSPMNQPLNNRQVEQLFQRFRSHRFFLAKDNLREVLVTR